MDYDYLLQLFSVGGFATIKNWLLSSMLCLLNQNDGDMKTLAWIVD